MGPTVVNSYLYDLELELAMYECVTSFKAVVGFVLLIVFWFQITNHRHVFDRAKISNTTKLLFRLSQDAMFFITVV